MSTTASPPNKSAVELLAERLDPDPAKLEIAKQRYADLGEWLRANGDFDFDVEVYPQGSMAIGTTNRDPQTGRFDLDCAVRVGCQRRDQVTQAGLNTMVGERLHRYARQRRDEGHHLAPQEEPEDKRRAWTLTYADGHMDVLPVIPDDRTPAWIGDPSLLTDKEFVRWLRTNPKGFADWFRQTDEQERRMRLAEAAAQARDVTVDDAPDFMVKTALQRAVQLVKRHRDTHFTNDGPTPPPSVMITTLATHAYAAANTAGSSSIAELVRAVVEGMRDHVVVSGDGRLSVPNPVDRVDDGTREDFADRLNEDPAAIKAFWAWMDRLRDDLGKIDASRPDVALTTAERGFNVEAAALASQLGVDPPVSTGAARTKPRGPETAAPGWQGRQSAPREDTERYA